MKYYRFIKVSPKADGGYTLSQPLYMDEMVDMFDALGNAFDIATADNAEIEFSIYNEPLKRWEILAVFHADGTATNVLGERLKWTGDKNKYWEDLEKHNRL